MSAGVQLMYRKRTPGGKTPNGSDLSVPIKTITLILPATQQAALPSPFLE
jgi:hypothetical protein